MTGTCPLCGGPVAEVVEDDAPVVGSSWIHREHNGWNCKVVAVMRAKSSGTNVVIEYPVGSEQGDETELDIVSLRMFRDIWEMD